MNARSLTATVAAAVSLLVLAGCDQNQDGIDDQTGKPVPAADQGSGAPGSEGVQWGKYFGPSKDTAKDKPSNAGCDPSGFGPLSGCSNSRTENPDHQAADFALDEGVDPASLPWRARHEAGHKAVADQFGWRVRYVRLNSDGSGRTQLGGFGWPCDCPAKRIALEAAGAVAAGTDEGADGDYAAIEDVLNSVPDADRDATRAAGFAEARRIVSARSAQIDRDAAELAAHGELR